MNTIMSGAALFIVVLALVLWQCSDWIEARAEQSRETARRLKLENDRLAHELTQDRTQDRTPARPQHGGVDQAS